MAPTALHVLLLSCFVAGALCGGYGRGKPHIFAPKPEDYTLNYTPASPSMANDAMPEEFSWCSDSGSNRCVPSWNQHISTPFKPGALRARMHRQRRAAGGGGHASGQLPGSHQSTNAAVLATPSLPLCVRRLLRLLLGAWHAEHAERPAEGQQGRRHGRHARAPDAVSAAWGRARTHAGHTILGTALEKKPSQTALQPWRECAACQLKAWLG